MDELTKLLAKHLLEGEHGESDSGNDSPFLVGKSYFVRTVTYHMVGRIEACIGKFLILGDASWVADSGRFMQAIKEGSLSEVEPVGRAFVNMDSIVDAFPWVHSLPDEQK